MSSITPIPELERLLDEKADAERALRQPAPTYADLTLGRTYPFRRDDLYDALTTDTIRALIDAVKAARWSWVLAEDCPSCCNSDPTDALFAALAPLFPDGEPGVVQDAQQCPTCNGHGGGGGFDRNGSHTENRYCEYPCPECGEEATDE